MQTTRLLNSSAILKMVVESAGGLLMVASSLRCGRRRRLSDPDSASNHHRKIHHHRPRIPNAVYQHLPSVQCSKPKLLPTAISICAPTQPSESIPAPLPRLRHRATSTSINPLRPTMTSVLHGSCACGRNRYVVSVPHDARQSAQILL